MKPSTFLVFFASIILFSCKPEVRRVDLFDMLKLIEDQRAFFDQNPARATRISVLNQTTDTLQLDTFRWESELEVFESFDLNKTRYKTDYIEKKESRDGNRVLSYSLEIPREGFTGIYSFSVTFRGQEQSPSRIEVEELANNLVYTSSNHYLLEFKKSGNDVFLHKVTMNGKQDLMLKDPLDYHFFTEINL